jgi:hypothetical protein
VGTYDECAVGAVREPPVQREAWKEVVMDGQNGKGSVALTAEERRFIVDCLANVSLQGKAAGLRPVLALMEGIVAKLAVGEEAAEGSVDSEQ